MKVEVIHGPNLNMLGKREPTIYGSLTLDEINEKIAKKAEKLGMEVDIFHSNSEGEIVSKIQILPNERIDGIVLNAAAYTHTSIAIRDALLSVSIPFVEVHISNVYGRESFRNNSYLSDIAIGIISGFGYLSYELALEALKYYLKRPLHNSLITI